MSLKMKKLGVDVELILMKSYIHGFNSFDMNMGVGIPEYKNGT